MASSALPWGRQAHMQQEHFQEQSSANSFFPWARQCLHTSSSMTGLGFAACISYFLKSLLSNFSLFPYPFVPPLWADLSELSVFSLFLSGPAFLSLFLLAPVHASPNNGKLRVDCLAGWWVLISPNVVGSQTFEEFWAKQCVFSARVSWADAIPAYARVCMKLGSPWHWPGHHIGQRHCLLSRLCSSTLPREFLREKS